MQGNDEGRVSEKTWFGVTVVTIEQKRVNRDRGRMLRRSEDAGLSDVELCSTMSLWFSTGKTRYTCNSWEADNWMEMKTLVYKWLSGMRN